MRVLSFPYFEDGIIAACAASFGVLNCVLFDVISNQYVMWCIWVFMVVLILWMWDKRTELQHYTACPAIVVHGLRDHIGTGAKCVCTVSPVFCGMVYKTEYKMYDYTKNATCIAYGSKSHCEFIADKVKIWKTMVLAQRPGGLNG